jgi:hypothetical protein
MSLQEAKKNEFLAPLLQDMKRGPRAVQSARRERQREVASDLMARRMLSSSTNESQSSDSDRSDAEGSSIAGSENRDDTDTDESEASDTSLDGSEDAMEESLEDVLSGRYYVIVIPERDGYPGASSRRFASFSSAVYFMYYGCVLSYETSTRNYTDFIQTRRCIEQLLDKLAKAVWQFGWRSF